MADTRPGARSGLEGLSFSSRDVADRRPGLTLELRPQPALASVIARRGAVPAIYEAARARLGVDLPETPKVSTSPSLAMIWTGAQQWLAMSEADEGSVLEARLRSALDGLASVSDQSDGRTILRLSGARSRDTLAKGMPIDLNAESFVPGQTAATLVGHIGVQIWQVDETPSYDIAVFRSFAVDLWRFLAHSGAEFGIEAACG